MNTYRNPTSRLFVMVTILALLVVALMACGPAAPQAEPGDLAVVAPAPQPVVQESELTKPAFALPEPQEAAPQEDAGGLTGEGGGGQAQQNEPEPTPLEPTPEPTPEPTAEPTPKPTPTQVPATAVPSTVAMEIPTVVAQADSNGQDTGSEGEDEPDPTPTPTARVVCLDTELPVGGDDNQFCYTKPPRPWADYSAYLSLAPALHSADEYREREAEARERGASGSMEPPPRVMVRIYMKTGVRSTSVKKWLKDNGVPYWKDAGIWQAEGIRQGVVAVYGDISHADLDLDELRAIIPVTLVMSLTQQEGIDFITDERQFETHYRLKWEQP